MLIKSCTQPHPCHTQGWGFLFFFRQYIHAGVLFSIVSELRSLPVQGTVLVSQGNIPESAHGLSVPIRRRPWPRDEPLSFFGTLATYVFRAGSYGSPHGGVATLLPSLPLLPLCHGCPALAITAQNSPGKATSLPGGIFL